MSVKHFVKQGECLSSIAKQYGFADYKTVYNHPENSTFKKKRPNPNVIYPGDIIVIPEKDKKNVDCATSSRHRFVVKRPQTKIRLVLADDSGKAFEGRKYRLTVDGRNFDGRTDSEGLVEQMIPPDAESGELVVFLNQGDDVEGYAFPLEFGHLDPPEQLSGAQARLLNLGYDCGRVSGSLDDETQAALEAFQQNNGLTVSGVLDDATVNKLREMHEG